MTQTGLDLVSSKVKVQLIVTLKVISNLFLAFDPSALREWWAAAVLHLGIIEWSNPPIPTLNTECRAGRPWAPCWWSWIKASDPDSYQSAGDTVPRDQWADGKTNNRFYSTWLPLLFKVTAKSETARQPATTLVLDACYFWPWMVVVSFDVGQSSGCTVWLLIDEQQAHLVKIRPLLSMQDWTWHKSLWVWCLQPEVSRLVPSGWAAAAPPRHSTHFLLTKIFTPFRSALKSRQAPKLILKCYWCWNQPGRPSC